MYLRTLTNGRKSQPIIQKGGHQDGINSKNYSFIPKQNIPRWIIFSKNRKDKKHKQCFLEI